MSNKIIDFDPARRIGKEQLKEIQDQVASLTLDDLESLIVVVKRQDTMMEFQAWGLEWEVIGTTETILAAIRQDIVAQQFLASDEDPEF
jgi:hypothetical protein